MFARICVEAVVGGKTEGQAATKLTCKTGCEMRGIKRKEAKDQQYPNDIQ